MKTDKEIIKKLSITNKKVKQLLFGSIPSETTPVVGNFNAIDFKKYQVEFPRKFYMTFTDYWKKEARKLQYKNKIK